MSSDGCTTANLAYFNQLWDEVLRHPEKVAALKAAAFSEGLSSLIIIIAMSFLLWCGMRQIRSLVTHNHPDHAFIVVGIIGILTVVAGAVAVSEVGSGKYQGLVSPQAYAMAKFIK